MAKSDAQRSAKLAEKRKKAGQVKVSVSIWTTKNNSDVARKAMKEASAKYKCDI